MEDEKQAEPVETESEELSEEELEAAAGGNYNSDPGGSPPMPGPGGPFGSGT